MSPFHRIHPSPAEDWDGSDYMCLGRMVDRDRGFGKLRIDQRGRKVVLTVCPFLSYSYLGDKRQREGALMEIAVHILALLHHPSRPLSTILIEQYRPPVEANVVGKSHYRIYSHPQDPDLPTSD